MNRTALILLLLVSALAVAQAPQQSSYPAAKEGDFVVENYRFVSGESLPRVSLHYTTFGTPARDASGRVTNAVLILHGTGGSGRQFLRPEFAGALFAPGQLLDAAKYFIVLPDNVGHGKSSKPSDGLHAKFPQYGYSDMVDLQHRLLVDGLKVNHLRLILGTSMGCMHSWVWGETFNDFMDALMPLACQPVQIAGRNRMWRKMAMDAIRSDPEWNGGDYTKQPRGLVTAADLLVLAGSVPLQMQKQYPTREKADAYLDQTIAARLATTDANDLWFALNASRDYDPSARLHEISVPVMAINTADDFINPPELGILER